MARYTLERKSYVNIIADNFQDTLKSGLKFACCTVGAGIAYGAIHDMEIISPDPSDPRIFPVLFAIGSAYYVTQIYKNYKKERTRFHELAIEVEEKRRKRKLAEKEVMKDFITPDQISRLQFQQLVDREEKIIELEKYRDILAKDSSLEKEEEDIGRGQSQGKRLAFNNGIYQADDNYKM